MKIIKPTVVIETAIAGEAGLAMLRGIERAARTCYKSEGKITDESAPEFVRKIVQVKKHESVIEHATITVRFVVDRGVTHELVRHRIAAFSQESTRYCNYSGAQFGKEITVIKPCFWSADDPKTSAQFMQWKMACESAEAHYFALVNQGASPQEARSVLPNSLKTELVMTANLREWRHVLALRTSHQAHPQMREVMVPLLRCFREELAPVFEDIGEGTRRREDVKEAA